VAGGQLPVNLLADHSRWSRTNTLKIWLWRFKRTFRRAKALSRCGTQKTGNRLL